MCTSRQTHLSNRHLWCPIVVAMYLRLFGLVPKLKQKLNYGDKWNLNFRFNFNMFSVDIPIDREKKNASNYATHLQVLKISTAKCANSRVSTKQVNIDFLTQFNGVHQFKKTKGSKTIVNWNEWNLLHQTLDSHVLCESINHSFIRPMNLSINQSGESSNGTVHIFRILQNASVSLLLVQKMWTQTNKQANVWKSVDFKQ